jgi:hypothetical protein
MSGFYEVTAASVDGGGRRIPGKALDGQVDQESSRRHPHPHKGSGRHRPDRHLRSPSGLASTAIGLPALVSGQARAKLHR